MEHLCKRCGETKTLDEDNWYRDKSSKTGFLMNGCRDCQRKERLKYSKRRFIAAQDRKAEPDTPFDDLAIRDSIARKLSKTTSMDMEI